MSILSIKNLNITLDHQEFVDQLSIDFKPGEVWGILGPNGAGKTTLLHALAGLHKPHAGNVLLNDQEITTLKPQIRAQKIGLLLQNTIFPFPCTVLETAMTGRYPYSQHWFSDQKDDVKIAEEALKQMHLTSFAKRSINNLSGGEQQRLAIATLLTQNPNIYLLDEPTNHLDIQQRMHTLTLFKKLAKEKNKTIVMILHDIHSIKSFCDKVILIGNGWKNVCGDCCEIITEEILQELFQLDFQCVKI